MREVKVFLVACALLSLAVGFGSFGQSIKPYQTAIDRFIVPYSYCFMSVTVRIGENEPASYTMETWTKGDEVSAMVIIDADVEFMIGLAFLQEGNQVTAWWPGSERTQTFSAAQSEQQTGFGAGALDQVIWNPEGYLVESLRETESEWEYRVEPKEGVAAGFAYGIVTVEKEKTILSQTRFWNGEDRLIEIDTIEDYKEFTSQAGELLLYPLTFIIEVLPNDKKTTMGYFKLEFPESLQEEVFTIDFLKEQSALVLVGGGNH